MHTIFRILRENRRVRLRLYAGIIATFLACMVFYIAQSAQKSDSLRLWVLEREIDQIVEEVLEESKQREAAEVIRQARVERKNRALEASVIEAIEIEPPEEEVHQAAPIVQRAVHPVREVPNWGAMRTSAEWDRTYDQISDQEFVAIPQYDLGMLTTPMESLRTAETPENIAAITAKLYYSTRFFGAYDLDSNEFEAPHPGIDLKLPKGTPVGSVAEGIVHAVRSDPNGLGLHLIIEHVLPDGAVVYSVYGHLASVHVSIGDMVRSGGFVARVGDSGNAKGSHLHLQIDRKKGEGQHVVYSPENMPGQMEADRWTMHPIEFIGMF